MSDQSDSSCLKLMVDLATGDDDDNSKVLMHPLTMKTLKVCDGDIILIKGKKLRDTICRAHVDESCKESKIRMNRVVRCNLRVYLGDSVTVHPCPDVKYGKRVHILPIHDSVYDDSFYAVSGNLVKGFLKPYFSEVQVQAYRPVTKGDVFLVPAMRSVEFKVIQIETEIDIDNHYCVVAPDTGIFCEGEPVKEEVWIQQPGYDCFGGN